MTKTSPAGPWYSFCLAFTWPFPFCLGSRCPGKNIKKDNYCEACEHKDGKHDKSNFKCDMCHFATSWRNKMKIHNEIKHEGVRYGCDQCSCKTSFKHNYIAHKRTKQEGKRQVQLQPVWL